MNRVGTRGYSLDLRERIVVRAQEGVEKQQVAKEFSVHRATVTKYLRKAEAGTLGKTGRSSGRPRRVQQEHEAQVRQQVTQTPDATLKEHAQQLYEVTGLLVAQATIHRLLKRLGITLKKLRR